MTTLTYSKVISAQFGHRIWMVSASSLTRLYWNNRSSMIGVWIRRDEIRHYESRNDECIPLSIIRRFVMTNFVTTNPYPCSIIRRFVTT